MAQLTFTVEKGVFRPASIGTTQLKPTAQGFASYAQNIDVLNNEYGYGIAFPGPSLGTITNNSEIAGVPIGTARAISGLIWFIEGNLGNTNIVRNIENVSTGSTPQIDTANTVTVTHASDTNIVTEDIILAGNGANRIYIVGKDDTDTWVQFFTATSGTPSLTAEQTLSNGSLTVLHRMWIASDDLIYILHGSNIDSLDGNGAYNAQAYQLPVGYNGTEISEYEQRLVIGAIRHTASTTFPISFARRKEANRSAVILFDLAGTGIERIVPCPSRYISAINQSPAGNLYIFGGLDDGMTTLYQFNNYFLQKVFSYKGEMPYNRHSVDFDGEGRILWQTADGQICRYDFERSLFEHLGTISATAGHGGVLIRLLSEGANAYFASAGTNASPDTFLGKIVKFGSYTGDGDTADDTDTPLVAGPLIGLPQSSRVRWVRVNLNQNLVSGDKISVRLYKNGSTTPTEIGTLSFSGDGAIASKTIKASNIVDAYALGIAWKTTDNRTTAPGFVSATVDFIQNPHN